MTNPIPQYRCSNCTWFYRLPDITDISWCRKHAPVNVGEYNRFSFPLTVADGYCGELQYSREYYENLDK